MSGSDRLANLGIRLPSIVLPWLLRPTLRQGVQQFIEGFGKQAYPFIQQFLSDLCIEMPTCARTSMVSWAVSRSSSRLARTFP